MPSVSVLNFFILYLFSHQKKVVPTFLKLKIQVMENKVSIWKANLNTGLILGLLGIVWTLFLWFIDQSLNQTLGYVFFIVIIAGLVLGIRSYRDKYKNGFITYGHSLGAGVIIMLYYSIITAAFTFILYSYIDPGLTDKMLAMTEIKMLEKGVPESMIEQSLKMSAKFMAPWLMAISGIFGGVLMGTVLSLIVSIFTRKEGNPLIDDAIEE